MATSISKGKNLKIGHLGNLIFYKTSFSPKPKGTLHPNLRRCHWLFIGPVIPVIIISIFNVNMYMYLYLYFLKQLLYLHFILFMQQFKLQMKDRLNLITQSHICKTMTLGIRLLQAFLIVHSATRKLVSQSQNHSSLNFKTRNTEKEKPNPQTYTSVSL